MIITKTILFSQTFLTLISFPMIPVLPRLKYIKKRNKTLTADVSAKKYVQVTAGDSFFHQFPLELSRRVSGF